MPVSVEQAASILGLNIKQNEGGYMNTVSGKVMAAAMKEFTWGNRYSFQVGASGQGAPWYSIFDSSIKSEEDKDLIKSLKRGDSVEFDYIEQEKDGRVYYNIVGATRVDQVGGDVADTADTPSPQEPNTSNTSAGNTRRAWGRGGQKSSQTDRESPDQRGRSMALAYVKDLIIASKIGLEEWDEWAKKFASFVNKGE